MVERVFDEAETEHYAGKDCKNVCFACGATTSSASDPSSASPPEPASSSYFVQAINENKEQFKECKTETFSDASFNPKATKDIVGNFKEFRIEHNKSDLRIIGNSNRVRIGQNSGNIQIIGNSTKLKVISNGGHIKYTGNEGRICLGSESAQQAVEYVGCNGLLKVVNSVELSASSSNARCKTKQKTTKCDDSEQKKSQRPCDNNLSSASSATTDGKVPPRKRMKVKSASYGGGGAQWDLFNEMFQRHHWPHFANMSWPNLRDNCEENKSSKSNGKQCNVTKNVNVVNQHGNIIIQNSVNVQI